MIDFGVAVAVLRDGQLLLVKQEDADVWCLPGGAVDAGEAVVQAAVREAKEETGLDVRLSRLVGIYSRPNWSSHQVVFAGEVVGGSIMLQEGESTVVGFLDPATLPRLVPWHLPPIRDLLEGVGGSTAWSPDWLWPFPPGTSRQQIYALRDQLGVSRAEFFARTFCQLRAGGERREV